MKQDHRSSLPGLWLAAIAIGMTAQTASARPSVSTDAAVFIERLRPGAMRSLEPAAKLSRGDRVITIVNWRRLASEDRGGAGFTITNPLPRTIAYQASARDDQDVSVDGGRVWGRLGELRIGGRLATPEDVTHIRWRVPADAAARGQGRIAYSGIVR